MIYSEDIEIRLHERLRRPASPSTVPGSLPVLFFGDLLMAKIATVSLNPSRLEYLNKRGEELDGPERRFETLGSLRAGDRSSLSAGQCNRAISTMRGYFDPGRPAYSWFAPLARVAQGMGRPYSAREAAHLDLVQEATVLPWSKLAAERPEEVQMLLDQDRPFLLWQLETFPLEVLVCNGKTTLGSMVGLTGADVIAEGTLTPRRKWTVAVATVGSRTMAVAGWNMPLAQAPGMTREEQAALGTFLREELGKHGFDLK